MKNLFDVSMVCGGNVHISSTECHCINSQDPEDIIAHTSHMYNGDIVCATVEQADTFIKQFCGNLQTTLNEVYVGQKSYNCSAHRAGLSKDYE